MNIKLLDDIKALEKAINKTKKEIIGRELHKYPYKVFDLSAYERGIGIDNITIKALKKELNSLIEEYGEDYENDRKLYNRITTCQQDVKDIKSKIYKMKQLERPLKDKAVIIREENSGNRITDVLTKEILIILLLTLVLSYLMIIIFL